MRPFILAVLLLSAVVAQGVQPMQSRRVVGTGSATSGWASAAVVAGDLVFVSAVTGAGEDGRLVGPDVESQTRRVLERLRGVLEAAGSSLAQAVSVNVYLRRAADFQVMNGAYREVFADSPPVRTTVVTDLPDGALIAMSAIGVPVGATREVLHPAGWMKSPRPYSYVVRAGGFVFLSGLLSRRGADDQFVPGPVGSQVRTILDNAGTLLQTAGLTHRDVVAARVYLTDESLFDEMNNEYRLRFTTAPPARATAVTDLVGIEASVEISLIASTTGKQVVGPSVSPSLPLSSAVRAGNLLFLSGVLGNTDANTGDVGAQTREIFTRIRRTLDAAGLSPADVVDNTMYLTDLWQRKPVEAVYGEFFPNDPPARTMVGTRLVARAGLIEMMMTAYVPR